MFKTVKEKISVFAVKNPSQTVLLGILILNILLFAVAALVISLLAPESLSGGFWASVYYTVCMVLDAGCIEYVIADIGKASVALILVCIGTVLIGMITFTGAVVGYVTNYISNFIENSRNGIRALRVSKHTVILNWNSRASEIINDLLYTGKKEIVVVLAQQDPDDIQREIAERISATLKTENALVRKDCSHMGFLHRLIYYRNHRMKNRVTVIVRDGETYSTKQLTDISVPRANTVIILSEEHKDSDAALGPQTANDQEEKGNANTIKTLVQVAEMTSSEESADAQTIIVEVEDDWTAMLAEQIIAHKERLNKCHIIPIYVNRILGQILSQFSIMPELNTVYSELFSNRGAEFFYIPTPWVDDVNAATGHYMSTHRHAIPLTIMQTASGNHAYSVANLEEDCERECPPIHTDLTVRLNQNYQIKPRNVVIIGHNSKCRSIMDGFNAFRGEHKTSDSEILNITVIDDPKNLERFGYYREYPYVTRIVEADIFDADKIKRSINEAIDAFEDDTSLLILSDDYTSAEDLDSAALTYLIYVQDIVRQRLASDPDFRREKVDVIVEILNPKNYDVVHNYSADNVVISNRYISKMVTQIGRKQALFEFYSDILTYDDAGTAAYRSKELYIKDVEPFFMPGCIPGRCTAAELIRAIYDASPEENKVVLLGYARLTGEMVLFTGDQDDIEVELTSKDKLIVFCNH